MKIYIYKLKDLDEISWFFNNPPSEMNLFNLFHNELISKYEIVDNLEESDVAFIPIDFTRLMFGSIRDNRWGDVCNLMGTKCKDVDMVPYSQPPTMGIGYKENYIRFFWNNYVKDHLNLECGKPHFILFSYVLFETSFEPIDKSIHILSYENQVSFFNTSSTYNIGTYDRMITIPYVQNENKNFNLLKIKKHHQTKKIVNVSFLGTISDEKRPVLSRCRAFLKYSIHRPNFKSYTDIIKTLCKSKYLFVLRGDTPSRLSFYQCFAFDVVPIIFQDEVRLYSEIISHPIEDCCLILPNKNDLNDVDYSKLVDKILSDELTNKENYISKIKNHKKIFHEINYFSKGCEPIRNALLKVKNGKRT